MFTITKQFSFSASHVLEGLPPNHPCSRLHGHNYRVEMVLKCDGLDVVGFVQDYRQLTPVKKFLDETFDHRHLNDVMESNPTAENIAFFLFSKFTAQYPRLHAVRVSETEKTWAEYCAPTS